MLTKRTQSDLLRVGPILTARVTISQQHRVWLEARGLAAPPPVDCRFLIDTGADVTVVRHEIAERAGLKLIDKNRPVHGVGVDITGRIYMGQVVFDIPATSSGIPEFVAFNNQILSADLFNAKEIDGLLGRDALSRFVVKYNGPRGLVELEFIPPENIGRLFVSG